MGAAQGDLAGGEIVEQGACALYLCEVEFFLPVTGAQVGTLTRKCDLGSECKRVFALGQAIS